MSNTRQVPSHQIDTIIIVVSFLAVLTTVTIGTPVAAAGKQQQQATAKSWIFTPDCNSVDNLRTYVAAQNSYASYIGQYEIVCYPSARDPMQVNNYLAAIRTVYPSDNAVFVFDLREPNTAIEFKMFLSTTDELDHYGALGKSFVDRHFAVAAFNGEVAAHELAHLTTGKHNHTAANMDNPGAWTD